MIILFIFISEWRHPGGKNISVATAKSRQIVAAVGKEVFYIEIKDKNLEQIRFFIKLCQIFFCFYFGIRISKIAKNTFVLFRDL